MAESEGIQAIVDQVAFQATAVVVMALSASNAGPRSGASTATQRESHKDMVDLP